MSHAPFNRSQVQAPDSLRATHVAGFQQQGSLAITMKPEAARDQYRQLQATGASPVTIGRFFSMSIEQGVWSSQSEVAKALEVSKAQVSKAVRAAKLPVAVLHALGGEERVTFRVAAMAEKMIESQGREVIVANALRMGGSHGLSTAEALTSLVTGTLTKRASDRLKVTIGGGGRYLKIESPHVVDLVENIALVEILLGGLVERFSRTRAGKLRSSR